MATVFPFNQLPKIPNRVMQQLAPVLFELQNRLLTISNELSNKISSLPPQSRCNDSRVTDIKNTITKLQTTIQSTQQVFSAIPQIASVFGTFAKIGKAVSSIQLAIPAVPGVPQGPIVQLLASSAELINNAESAVKSINNLISSLPAIIDRINSTVETANSTLQNLCNDEFDPAGKVSVNVNGQSLVELDLETISNLYPSTFYLPVNVSDSDIQQRLQAIQDLLVAGGNVSQNLNEAPSAVIVGNSVPTVNIGKIGDYYINTTSQTIYGPKVESGWNTGINY